MSEKKVSLKQKCPICHNTDKWILDENHAEVYCKHCGYVWLYPYPFFITK